jgi:predicted NBD/HSP70 family sugar kinase
MFIRWVNKQSPSSPAAGWVDMRAHNASLLLGAIWTLQQTSRADLARITGLSRATVSDIIHTFLEAGVVTEAEAAPSSGGRPPIRLCFEDGWRHLIGLELGASHVVGLRCDLRGKVLGSFEVHHDIARDPAGTLAHMDAGIEQLLSLDRQTPVAGLGLGVPSPVRPTESGQLSPHLFPQWEGIDLCAHLRERHHLPVRMDNDANLGALAEHWWGAGQEVSDFAYIKMATGVGAGILIGGRIYRGAAGIAGEIGHTAIDPHGPRCRCGLHGCLEALVGTASLLQRTEEQLCGCERPTWATPSPTVRGLIDAALAGDPLAQRVIASAGAAMGIALANLLNLVNPARVILGGHLTEAGGLLLNPMRAVLAQRTLWSSIEASTLVVSALGDRAVALGAVTLLLQELLEQPSLSLAPDAGRSTGAAVPLPLFF